MSISTKCRAMVRTDPNAAESERSCIFPTEPGNTWCDRHRIIAGEGFVKPELQPFAQIVAQIKAYSTKIKSMHEITTKADKLLESRKLQSQREKKLNDDLIQTQKDCQMQKVRISTLIHGMYLQSRRNGRSPPSDVEIKHALDGMPEDVDNNESVRPVRSVRPVHPSLRDIESKTMPELRSELRTANMRLKERDKEIVALSAKVSLLNKLVSQKK